ncbi:MAG: carotenoid biosynthesis protein [Halobacteriaceae archaeon]
MVEAVFAANAVIAILGLALVGWHAVPDRDRLLFLGAALVYGVVLEQLVILHFDAYTYNIADAILTVGDVPLVIGVGWATIIYSGVQVARRLGVSARLRPLFVALFALHIDLAIDAIAIRVPFWTWARVGAWFGVPLGNFTGWFLVASCFVASWQAVRDRVPSRALAGPLTIVLAVAGLVVVLEGWTIVATTLRRKVVILGGAIAGSAALVFRDGLSVTSIDPRIGAIPYLYHGFYLAVLVDLGLYRQRPFILAVSLAMIGLWLLVHRGALPGVDGSGRSV